jgi:cell wall-associated NlpC family hydrolase
MQSKRDLFVSSLLAHLNLAGIWAGQSLTTGVDCSGFVGEMCKVWGLIPIDMDNTAQGYYNHFEPIEEIDVQAGDMVFYKNSNGKIIHIDFYIGHGKVIGSLNCSRSIKTVEQAKAVNAGVQIADLYRGRQIAGYCRLPIDTGVKK